MKRSKKLPFIIMIIVLFLVVSIFISLDKFNTLNPFNSGAGLFKIMFTSTPIVKIQEYPKVYLAKPENSQQLLIDFMESRGYHHMEEEQMGSIMVFSNETSSNYVAFSVNRYYSKWVFRE